MSAGIVQLASRSGRAIVPTAYLATNNWRFAGNWTTLIVPWPFNRVILAAADLCATGRDPRGGRRILAARAAEMEGLEQS